MSAGGVDASRIDETLVRGLLREQFPVWRELPLRAVARGGNDHRIYHLGDDLCVRLPSAPAYVPQVEKEQVWLPRLAPHLPLAIPTVRGVGQPSSHFPAPWSVYGWLDGEPAAAAVADDPLHFAADLAAFLSALRSVDTTGAPGPGLHSAFRGGPLTHWDEQVGDLLQRVRGRERELAAGIWREALAASFSGPAQWFHGDVSVNNLLAQHGRLSAVIDFGCSGVGDTACDTVIVWTYLHGAAREVFRRELAVDEATWARGRGWALWKALVMMTNKPPGQAELARHVLDQLFAEVSPFTGRGGPPRR